VDTGGSGVGVGVGFRVGFGVGFRVGFGSGLCVAVAGTGKRGGAPTGWPSIAKSAWPGRVTGLLCSPIRAALANDAPDRTKETDAAITNSDLRGGFLACLPLRGN
jgi:hypothetical protein